MYLGILISGKIRTAGLERSRLNRNEAVHGSPPVSLRWDPVIFDAPLPLFTPGRLSLVSFNSHAATSLGWEGFP